jgi:hypothetical protein
LAVSAVSSFVIAYYFKRVQFVRRLCPRRFKALIRWEQQDHLTKMLRGFYQYFGLHHCARKLNWVRQQVQRQWVASVCYEGSTPVSGLGISDNS